MEKRLNPVKKKRKAPKSFVWDYDETSECMVLEIKDVNGMFPLILKVPSARPYRLILTQNGKLQIT